MFVVILLQAFTPVMFSEIFTLTDFAEGHDEMRVASDEGAISSGLAVSHSHAVGVYELAGRAQGLVFFLRRFFPPPPPTNRCFIHPPEMDDDESSLSALVIGVSIQVY